MGFHAELRTLATAATIYLASVHPHLYVYSALFKVNSLGGGTYIKVGSYLAQVHQMKAVDETYSRDAVFGSRGEMISFDINEIAFVSDGTDAVLEITAITV